MKFLAIVFIILICLLQYRIWWGEGSNQTIIELKQKIAEQTELNKLLELKNADLKQEIMALRENPAILEEKAREQLGLIKPDETFYRIIPKSTNP